MFRIKAVEKIKTHFMFNNGFSKNRYHSCDDVEKYGGAREAADNNIAAHCMLDK
jgi:hypothetical protein